MDLTNEQQNSGHFITEVYDQETQQWIACEPQYGYFYINEKGKPLSVLEVHEEVVKKKSSRVFKYPQREPVNSSHVGLFYNFRFYLRNNFLSVPVFYYTKVSVKGKKWNFEPYTLRWVGVYPQRSGQPLESLNPMDFNYPVKFHEAQILGDISLKELQENLQQSLPGTLFKAVLPKKAFEKFIFRKFIRDQRYIPLR